jgi:hypothetical protein
MGTMMKQTRRGIAALVGLVVTAGLPIVTLAASPASATTQVSDEAGIRAAFQSGADSTIELAADITLSTCTGHLFWTADSDLTINGNGHTLSVSSPCAIATPHRVIFYRPNSAAERLLSVHNLTIQRGVAPSGGKGGAILAENLDPTFGASLLVDQGSQIGTPGDGNAAPRGGGLASEDGNITVDHATVSSNTSTFDGGGIFTPSGKSVTAVDSTIVGNSAGGAGGGISGSNVTVTRSTIEQNIAGDSGGGIQSVAGNMTITNSTITDNQSQSANSSDGGGVHSGSGTTSVVFSTIVHNTAPTGGAANLEMTSPATATFFGSVVADPAFAGRVNCQGAVTSLGYNFSDVNDCGFGGGTGDIAAGGAPGLEALANTGGPTRTMRPTAGSPLRNKVPAADCTNALAPDQDQRGVLRPSGGLCEIGAVERKPPGPPTGVSATPQNGAASVSFTAPASAGDSNVNGYLATCSNFSNPTRTGSSPLATPITVTNMVNGVTYTCTVHANNVEGSSVESAPAFVAPRTVPSAPTNVVATPGNGQMSVSFDTPNNGGAPITSFTVTESPEGVITSGGSSPINVTGLTNEIAHTFVVKATNVAGTGPDSAASAPATSTAPDAPTGVSATPGNHQMSVAFTPPANDGRPVITSYTVTATPGGATASGATSPIVVTGLANNLAYTFKVKATNLMGTGPESAASAPKATVFQPDVMARKSTSPAFTDLNAYSVANTASTTVKLGKSVTFVIRVFNDGTATDTINLKAALSGNNHLSYTFKDGAATLSNLTTTGRNYTLAPGALKQITVVVKANSGTPLNANRTATLTSRSLSQTNKLDQVKVKVTRN